MGWRATIACLLLAAACASRGGWVEGEEVDAEVRRVLASEPREGIRVDTSQATLQLGAGLETERSALLGALARAEALPARQRCMQAVLEALDPAQPAGPRPLGAACAPPEVTEIRIRYPDCLCRARRVSMGNDVLGYSVDIDDRRFGDERDLFYRMRLVPSPALDASWDALLAAADRSPTSRALGEE